MLHVVFITATCVSKEQANDGNYVCPRILYQINSNIESYLAVVVACFQSQCIAQRLVDVIVQLALGNLMSPGDNTHD